LRAVVINLDRSIDRLAAFRDQAERHGLTFERLPAVDASTIGPVSGVLRKAEVACFESHRLAWRLLVDSGEPWCAVFEDDVHLSSDIVRLVAEDGWIPAGADLIKLETLSVRTMVGKNGEPAPGGRRLHELLDRHNGAAGYILSRRAAVRLLECTVHVEDVNEPVDEVIFNLSRSEPMSLRCLQLIPAVCIQDNVLAHDEGRTVVHRTLVQLTDLRPTSSTRVGSKVWREVERLGRQLAALVSRVAQGPTMVRSIKVPFR
jgi:glycosyl transferase family 25